MSSLEIVVILGVAIAISAVAAPRLRIAAPLVLVAVGLLLGFVPDLREIHLPSETVLILFLPALLFWESLTTSLRSIRRDLRGVLLTSTVLVVATAFAVAGVGVAMGMSWQAALILGAAIAPTDATAVSALARSIPRRQVDVLKAESLINDGTALVIYAIAVGVATGGAHYSGWRITGMVALSYVGGAAAGLAIALLGRIALARVSDPTVRALVFLVVPFVAFLLAEQIHASGVIGVVVAGLALSRFAARVTDALSRRQTVAFWSLAAYVLNGALFVLVGIEVQNAVRSIPSAQIGWMLLLVVLTWIVMIVVRFGFLVVSAYAIRILDRRPEQRLRRMSNRARVVSTLAGFRGAISLAAALAVPAVVASGEEFASRDQIVFVSAGVIVLTLVVQGLLLPIGVRWAHYPEDTSLEDEIHQAERATSVAAVEAIPDLAGRLDISAEVRDRLLDDYREHAAMSTTAAEDLEGPLRRGDEYVRLRLAVIARKQEVLFELRESGDIDEPVMQRLLARLDIEELRLSRPEQTE